MKLVTQADVVAALRALDRSKSIKRRAELRAAIDDAESRAVPCDGEAHTNPWIDNCHQCAPFWGVRMPS